MLRALASAPKVRALHSASSCLVRGPLLRIERENETSPWASSHSQTRSIAQAADQFWKERSAPISLLRIRLLSVQEEKQMTPLNPNYSLAEPHRQAFTADVFDGPMQYVRVPRPTAANTSSDCEEEMDDVALLEASSTLKKRRLKMNKHKYRKRRKRDRRRTKR